MIKNLVFLSKMDTNHEELLSDILEKCVKVRKLLNAPEVEDNLEGNITLKRKNEAIDILKEVEIKLEDALNNDDSENDEFVVMLAMVRLDIGIVHIDNEELETGEKYLMCCVETLAGREATVRCILTSLGALNQLGSIWFRWCKPTKSESFFKEAEKIYKTFIQRDNSDAIGLSSLFGIKDGGNEPDAAEVLEELHTLTLSYLAKIYGITKDHEKSAEYSHMTLRRQLDHANLDRIDWALNAATLSQFFMEKGSFAQARHHLAAASYILMQHEASLARPTVTEDEASDAACAEWERFNHRNADVARRWAKYGIVLMIASKDRLFDLAESSESSEKRSELEKLSSDSYEQDKSATENMTFVKLEKEIEPFAERITSKHLLDLNDARSVFLNIQNWLDEAKKYYTFESHASDYVRIMQDMSEAYKYLSFFEDNEGKQAKMHKRRIDILESVANELNPRYYQAECRQMWIELAETYFAILNIKLDKLRPTDDLPTLHALNKINKLSQSSIKYYQKFLDSLKETENSPAVTKFTEETVRPALSAYFHLGTLYNHIVTPDKNAQLENRKKSIEAYQFFVDYCESNEELAEFMKAELNVCKDLPNWLPLKMSKLL